MNIKNIVSSKKLGLVVLAIIALIVLFEFIYVLYFWTLLFTLLLIIDLWIVNNLWKRKIEKEFIQYPGRINSYKNYKRNYDFVAVGGSEAVHGVDFSQNDNHSGFNWGMKDQTLKYDFMVLKNFFSILKKDGNVLIFITPMTCYANDSNIENTNKYQLFLDRFLFHSTFKNKFYFRDWIVSNTLLRKKKDNMFMMSIHYYPILYPITVIKIFKELKHKKKALLSNQFSNKEMLEKQSQNYHKRVLDLVDASHENNSFYENKMILIEMIKYLKQRDLNPVIVFPPFAEVLNQKLSKDKLNNCLKQFTDIAAENNSEVLNFTESSLFLDDSLFLNANTLNKSGRKLLTELIFEKLK